MNFNTLTQAKVPAVALAAVLGLASLAGCESDAQYEYGKPATVLAHKFYAAHVVLISVKPLILMPVPDKYDLDMRQCGYEGKPGTDAQGCVTEEVEVTKEIYEATHDGDEVTLQK